MPTRVHEDGTISQVLVGSGGSHGKWCVKLSNSLSYRNDCSFEFFPRQNISIPEKSLSWCAVLPLVDGHFLYFKDSPDVPGTRLSVPTPGPPSLPVLAKESAVPRHGGAVGHC